jgi:hypothetical protein
LIDVGSGIVFRVDLFGEHRLSLLVTLSRCGVISSVEPITYPIK